MARCGFLALFAIVFADKWSSLLFVLFYAAVSPLALFESYKRHLQSSVQSSSEMRQNQVKAKEMRNLIANIAHDLKTVSTSLSRSFLSPLLIIVIFSA